MCVIILAKPGFQDCFIVREKLGQNTEFGEGSFVSNFWEKSAAA